MATTIFLLLAATFTWTGAVFGETDLKLNAKEISQILKYHNAVRGHAKATAMRKLTYSQDLAKEAEKIAAKCNYRNRIPGVNMYPGAGATHRPKLHPAIKWWWGESSDYHFLRTTCKPGRTCYHYTQMVYNMTKEVGCGMAYCADVKHSPLTKGGHLIVCKYSPAGPGKRTQPYEAASHDKSACSECSRFGARFWCAPGANLCEQFEETPSGSNNTHGNHGANGTHSANTKHGTRGKHGTHGRGARGKHGAHGTPGKPDSGSVITAAVGNANKVGGSIAETSDSSGRGGKGAATAQHESKEY